MTEDWKWYFGHDEEVFHEGPFDTREEALTVAKGYGTGVIVEAYKVDQNLASYFDVDQFLEQADEDAWELLNPDGDPLFDTTMEQRRDLELRVRKEIYQWEKDHNLTFTPWCFTSSRNLEWIR